MKYLFLCLFLALTGFSIVNSVTIDTLSENTGLAAQNDFCACSTQNNTCYQNLNALGATAIGNNRAMILYPQQIQSTLPWTVGCRSQQGVNYNRYCALGLEAQTGCPSSGCLGQYGQGGQLEYSSPVRSTSQLYIIWNGGCPTDVSNINYSGLGGVDITDAGISDSFNMEVGKVDLSALLAVQIWSDATHGSNASFDPSVFAFRANLDSAYTRVTLPFNTFTQIPGTAGPASFSHVGAIVMIITASSSVDLIISLIETAGTLVLTKSATISVDNGTPGVADPGDIITFNATLSYPGTGLNAATVFFWDDPATDYVANNNTFPYYTLVPGSLLVQYYQIGVSTGVFTPIAPTVNATQINGPDVQANLGRVVLYLGDIPSYTAWTVQFSIMISSSLPCCLPQCREPCTGTNGESCYCVTNTAYFCEALDAGNLNVTTGNGNKPNFTTAFVSTNCGPTTTSVTVNRVKLTTATYTLTPVYAPSSPYTAFTSTLVASAVAGNVIPVPFRVGNNGTRDTAASITFTYPSSLVTPSGSTSPFTCSAGTCTTGSTVTILAGATIPYTLSFSVNPVTGCGNTPAIFTVAITPNGCPTATAGSGLGSCIDVNIADNSATSSTVGITGAPSLSLTLNTSISSISPGGSAPLSLCYSNTGVSSAPQSVVTITLPTGFSGSSSGAWTCNGVTCTYNIGTIAAGLSACTPLPQLIATWNVATLTCVNPTLSVNATLSGPCGTVSSTTTLNPTATTAISLTKTGPSSVVVGTQINYSLTYTNNGTRQYNSITLTETVPQNTVYSGTGWTCTGTTAGSTCTLVISPPTPQTSVTFSVTVNSQSCSTNSITNTATAQGTCTQNPAFSTSIATATFPTTVTGNPDLFITKRATDGNGNTISGVVAGGSVTYVLTYGNRGNRVTDAVITENAVGSPFTFTGPGTWSSPNANGARTFAISALAPGQNGTVNFVVTAASTLGSCSSPPVPNSASIATSAPCVENNLADNTANVSVSVSASSDLYVNFQPITTTPVVPNVATASLVFCYGNLGNSADTNSNMTVTLPATLTVSSSGNSGWTINGNTATVNLGTIGALASQVCRSLIVNLPSTLNCNDSGFNGTVAIVGDCTETNVANNQAPWYLPVTATYDLSVTKTQPNGATFRQTSPTVVYSIGYANAGGRSVNPVVLTEYLPQYTTFVPASSDPRWVAAGNGVYTINLGTVAANSNSTTPILFAVSISLPIPSNVKLITNTVNVNMTGNCPAEVNLPNNVAPITTPVVGNPDVFVLKTDFAVSFFGNASSSSNPRFAGDVAVYTLSFGNNGDSDANTVVLTETVPANTFFYAALSSPGWSCPDNSSAMTSCNISVGPVPIPAGGGSGVIAGTRQFALRVGTFSPSTYPQAIRCVMPSVQNFVTIAVGSDQVDLNLVNNNANETTPMVGFPNLVITKTDNFGTGSPRRAGDNIVYTITYSNIGVREATNIVISDTIAPYTIYNAQYSSPGWICPMGGAAGTNCTYTIGTLAPGQTTTALSLAVTVLNGFPSGLTCVTNAVSIDNTCGESDYSDNRASVCTPVTGYFDLVLQKHGYCETILYQMTYTNIGTIGARDVYLKTYVPVDSSFDALNSNAGWVCADITPGSECLLRITNVSDPTSFLAPGAGGMVDFAIDPYPTSMSSTFTLDSSVDDNWTGDNLDPTPDNNRVSTTVGFSGCAQCNSCCPPVDTCCPDYTDVNFVFSGVLDGIKTCSS